MAPLFLLPLLFAAVLALAPPPATAGTPAPQPMLAERHHAGIDPTAYWVSEKYDGVRARWDGHALRLRNGGRIAAPDWFTAALPAETLDGELWMGRRSFDRLSGLVRRQAPDDPAWRAVRYMVFELPGASGDFSARIERIRRIADAAGVPWLQAVPQRRVSSRGELQGLLDEVVRGGGEGLMLHRADAHWTAGRSPALLKLTPWLDDEARVIAHLPGKGRLAGMTGSLLVEAPDGRRFRLGSGLTDAQRRDPPPPGSLVTYRYRELTPNGLPRFPRFLRMRELP
ncbi:DNA ligase [Pseudothauera nasutitermitis]|uniref:DNA ligase n=1 Tax=Pseudothauera nasutitermitis TaxID=2565930 RepID=A0A4S4AUN7_9RHOO|nr:DNA ligase [Pseudothauera nasutitermitis]THF62951.1 DNA ligase [Pseudothauera nasutitermitis]